MRTWKSLHGSVASALVAVMVASFATVATAQSESPALSESPAQTESPEAPAPVIEPIGAFTVGDLVGYPSGHDYMVSVPSGSTVRSLSITVPPGFDFGWHHHTGSAIVAVTAGTFTVYDPTCASQEFSAGEGFVEEVDTPHRGRNEGTEDVALTVTFLGVPADMDPTAAEATEPCQVDS